MGRENGYVCDMLSVLKILLIVFVNVMDTEANEGD